MSLECDREHSTCFSYSYIYSPYRHLYLYLHGTHFVILGVAVLVANSLTWEVHGICNG